MATKKKTKATASSKAKKGTAKKIAKKPAAKSAAKKAAVALRKKAAQKAKRTRVKQVAEPMLPHGEDLYLIPLVGDIHPARTEDAPVFEKAFKHNTEVAFHQEQQRMKQIVSRGSREYKKPRQS